MIKSVKLLKSTDVKPEPIYNAYLFVVYSYNDLDDIQYDFQFTEGGIVDDIILNNLVTNTVFITGTTEIQSTIIDNT